MMETLTNYWDMFVAWWYTLTQSFRESLSAQVIGGIIAGLIVSLLAFFAGRFFLRKKPTSSQPIQSSQSQEQKITQHLNINIPPSQILENPPAPIQVVSSSKSATPQIPHPPIIGFVVRRDKEGHDLIEYVSELLEQSNAFIVLWGEGGIGKTALAGEIARKRESVIWISADGRADFSLNTLLDEIVTQLGHPEYRTFATGKKLEDTRNLLSDSHGLLVLDNFETIRESEQTRLAEFLASSPCAVLATLRKAISKARNIPIDAMSPGEAREFVEKLIQISPRRDVFTGLDARKSFSRRQQIHLCWNG